jgi:hypothetical protein
MMIPLHLRSFKILSFFWITMLAATPLWAASTATYPGSEYYSFAPNDWSARVTVDEVSGSVPVNLVQDIDTDGSSGLLEAIAEVGPSTTPARVAQRSPVDNSTAIGRGRVADVSTASVPMLQNIGDSSGVFSGNLGERIRIQQRTALGFDIEYNNAANPNVNGVAVICLMPIQLAIIEGGVSTNPSEAIFSYYLEIDGEEIYTNSMKLTKSVGGAVQLTAPEGTLRTDGVFFEDTTYNTIGFNFPAITLELPMGVFSDGDSFEGLMEFSTTIEADDNGWGAYAGPSSTPVDPNTFIPSFDLIPEPQSAALLGAGLLILTLRRRAR